MQKNEFGVTNRVELAKKLGRRLANEIRGESEPIGTPFQYLTEMMKGGFSPGETTSIAGVVGGGKTYLSIELCINAEKQGISWIYMPLEIKADEILQRFIAVSHNKWSYMGRGKEKSKNIVNFVFDNPDLVKKYSGHIAENPRTPAVDIDGNIVVPDVPWSNVISWLKGAVNRYKFIVIDPISLIDYSDNGKDYIGQREFVKQAVSITENSNAHLVIVCHLTKRGGARAKYLTMDNMEGSTAISRHVYNVILLDKHREMESDIRCLGGYQSQATHKKMMILDKIRNGIDNLAFATDFDKVGPTTVLHGVITG